MVWLCRLLFLFSFALYWGGLTFYTGFVVRISHDILNDPMDGGLITQRVTVILQILGVVTVVTMLCNAFDVARYAKARGITLVVCALVLGLAVAMLFVVHAQLDSVIDADTSEITDRVAFKARHRRYNQVTTIQWIMAVIYLPLTVFAWRHVDQKQAMMTDCSPSPEFNLSNGDD